MRLLCHTKSTLEDGANHAIGRRQLSVDKVSTWKVTIVNLASFAELYVGIVGKGGRASTYSQWNGSSCSWGSVNNSSFVGVKNVINPEGEGGTWSTVEDSGREGATSSGSVWRSGDVATFTFDPQLQQLEMKRYGCTYLINTVHLPPQEPVFMNFSFNNPSTEIIVELL